MKPDLLFIPFGGLGEIGMNMMVLECGEDAIIIDCGVMFPESVAFGVDLIIPDFSYLKKNEHKIRGLILTHGHEDHIGAVPFLLKKVQIPKIWGSSFTLALLKSKFPEHKITFSELHEGKIHKKIKLGIFTIEFLQVSHSIVEGMGLAIETPQGIVIHTADFKIDTLPYRGKRITLDTFKEYGKKNVLLLLSDSTNVEREGKSLTEDEIRKELFQSFKKSPGRIIFSVFATNVRRIEGVLEDALKLGRKVAISGRSMETIVPIARQLKFISPSVAHALIPIESIRNYDPQKLIILCTGSQAEERSALWRIAQGEHRHIRIQSLDTVILSSKFIPGNEKAISQLINNLYRKGAEVLYEKVAQVHVSGHAYQDELKQMIKAVKPRFFIPIHGEYRHLVRHGRLAQEMNISNERIFVCENGNRIQFQNNVALRLDPLEVNRTFVNSERVIFREVQMIKERRQLSEAGIIFVIVVRDQKKILIGPNFFTKGVIKEEEHQSLLQKAKNHIIQLLNTSKSLEHDLYEEIRVETRRFFKNELGIKPIVLPILLNLGDLKLNG